MAITTVERSQIIELVTLMFNAAPGATYLSQIVAIYEANPGASAQKLGQLAHQLTLTPVYKTMHPNFETVEEFAAKVLTPLGLQADTFAKDFIVSRVNGGMSHGQLFMEAFNALNNLPTGSASQYTSAAAVLNNKAFVAEYYSVTAAGAATDLSTLQNTVASVTSTQASVDAAIATISGTAGGGQTFTLTTSEDSGAAFTGSGANDVFDAPVVSVNGTLTQTLQAVDALNGGTGTDTLNATVQGGNAGIVAASLTSIENINVRSTADNSGLSLAAASGVQKITVANSTGTADITNVGAVASFAVSNQKKNVTFNDGTATTVALSAIGVGTVSATAPVEVTVNFDDNAFTSANLSLDNSNIALTNATAGNNDLKSVSIAATGSNTLKLTAGATTVETVTVTGGGSVNLTGATLSAVKTLTVGDGGITITGDATAAAGLTATTGAGKDTLTFNASNVKSISTGAGDDAVTLKTGTLAATATVSLGDGKDTITFQNNAPTAGATIDGGAGVDTFAATAAIYNTVASYTAAERALISNFEVLSITDTLANGATIDVSSLTGVGSFTAAAGVAAGGTANVVKLGADSTVTIAGTNTAVAPSAGTAETATFTFADITAAAGGTSTLAINGVTVTVAAGQTATAADIATAFATATTAGNATVSGAQNAAYTAAVTTAGVVRYTAAAVGDQGNLAAVAGGTGTAPTAPAPVIVNGTPVVVAQAAGTLSIALATDTASDTVHLVLNNTYTENNDATKTTTTVTNSVSAASIETVHVDSTGKASTPFLAAEGTKADAIKNILVLSDDALATLNVTGNQAFEFSAASTMSKLAAINASALTAAATISASNIAASTTAPALTITGSQSAANTLTGSANADTIVGGSKADTITGGAGGDKLTGGTGNDTFVYTAAGHSTLANLDVIADFSANTYGTGTAGAIGTSGGAGTDSDLWNGDVLKFAADAGVAGAFGTTAAKVSVQSNAADAQTYLQNIAADATVNEFAAALDSSSGRLYVDLNADGTVDSVVQLTGVTTITAAAFVVV